MENKVLTLMAVAAIFSISPIFAMDPENPETIRNGKRCVEINELEKEKSYFSKVFFEKLEQFDENLDNTTFGDLISEMENLEVNIQRRKLNIAKLYTEMEGQNWSDKKTIAEQHLEQQYAALNLVCSSSNIKMRIGETVEYDTCLYFSLILEGHIGFTHQ